MFNATKSRMQYTSLHKKINYLFKTNKTEFIQAFYLRLPISALLLFIYIPVISNSPNHFNYALGYFISSLIIAIHLYLMPVRPGLRKIFSYITDIGFLSLMTLALGENALYMLPLLILFTIDYGLRYGRKNYLLSGTLTLALTIYIGMSHRSHSASVLLIVFPISALILYLYYTHNILEKIKSITKIKNQLLYDISKDLIVDQNFIFSKNHEIQSPLVNYQTTIVESMNGILKLKGESKNHNIETFNLLELFQKLLTYLPIFSNNQIPRITFNIDPSTPVFIESNINLVSCLFISILKQIILFNNAEVSIRITSQTNKNTIHLLNIEAQIIQLSEPNTETKENSETTNQAISKNILSLLKGDLGIKMNDQSQILWYSFPFNSVNKTIETFDQPRLTLLLLTNDILASKLIPTFKKRNIEYIYAKSTASAYKRLLASDEDFDLMILDNSVMKDHDPKQFSDILRGADTIPEIPLILIGSMDSINNYQIVQQRYLTIIDYHNVQKHIPHAIYASQYLNTKKQAPINEIASGIETKTVHTAIDNEKFNRLIQIGKTTEFIAALVKSYKEDVTNAMEILKNAQTSDYKLFREKIHAIKSSSYEIGANEVVDFCIEAEKLTAEEIGTERIELKTHQLEAIIAHTFTTLDEKLNLKVSI